MRLLSFPAAILIFTACTDGDGFGGEDPGWLQPGDEFSLGAESAPGGSDVDVGASFDEATCDEQGEPIDESLMLEGGAELIAVQHSFMGNCCADWELSGDVSAGRFEVTYTDLAEACDCECPWTLQYTIQPVEPGEWTVAAGSSEATTTVQEAP